MTRTHNSHKIFELNKFTYSQYNGGKPRGFWYGIDNDWLDWCNENMPEWVGKYNYILELNELNILSIKSDAELLEFEKSYLIKNSFIDWKKVSEEFDGIEIINHLKRFAVVGHWYNGWDCASGCVWNLEKLKVKLI